MILHIFVTVPALGFLMLEGLWGETLRQMLVIADARLRALYQSVTEEQLLIVQKQITPMLPLVIAPTALPLTLALILDGP